MPRIFRGSGSFFPNGTAELNPVTWPASVAFMWSRRAFCYSYHGVLDRCKSRTVEA